MKVKGCGLYGRIKQLEHGMKTVERVIDNGVSKMVKIDNISFGFIAEHGTTDIVLS